ncbi:hypothetical protein BU17DRAFT_89495 [Hysterangium stoloniferum]|nr:hypothetical protein BU17DRAFT_89495 [Hysterangium stoloniferum]
MSVIARDNDVEDLISPGVASSLEQSHQSYLRKHFREILRDKWACEEPGHNFCLRGMDHIPLSEGKISQWVEEICRGEASCLNPPDVLIPSKSFDCNEIVPVDCGATDTYSNDEILIGPGYFCGVALERVGIRLLYGAKVLMMTYKLAMYRRKLNLCRRSYPSPQVFGIMIQESVELMRPCYPSDIQKRASNILRDASEISLTDKEERSGGNKHPKRPVLGMLGLAFGLFGNAVTEGHKMSTEIISSLYQSLMSAPLHIYYNEITSAFIKKISRYLNDSSNRYHKDVCWCLTQIVEKVCRLRRLSHHEFGVMRSFMEFLIQPPCNKYDLALISTKMQLCVPFLQQDSRLPSLPEVLMEIALDITVSDRSLPNFKKFVRSFDWRVDTTDIFHTDRIMLKDYTSEIDRIASFFVFYLRSSDISSQRGLKSIAFGSFTNTINIMIMLIAASPDVESSCTDIRAEKTIDALVDFISHFDALGLRPDDNYEDFSGFQTTSQCLLCLIATPFTGLSVSSNLYCLSLLREYQPVATSAFN